MEANTLLWLAVIFGVLLAIYLLSFIKKQLRQIKTSKSVQNEALLKNQQQRAEIIESIRVIAACRKDEQVEPTEACIRIKVLLDFIAPELHTQSPYSVFNLVYEKTQHMPTHDAWKALSKKEKKGLEKERLQIEKDMAHDIQQGIDAILKYHFKQN